MEIIDLCENDWVSLKMMVDPANGVGGYVFSHETRCNGEIISILPIRTGESRTEFLLRSEITPCWGMDSVMSTITGGVEDGQTPTEAAQMELREEAGYDVPVEALTYLGTCFGTKSTDTIYHLFTVDLTEFEQGEAHGDGSELESQGFCFWADEIETQDPLMATIHYRIGREEHYA